MLEGRPQRRRCWEDRKTPSIVILGSDRSGLGLPQIHSGRERRRCEACQPDPSNRICQDAKPPPLRPFCSGWEQRSPLPACRPRALLPGWLLALGRTERTVHGSWCQGKRKKKTFRARKRIRTLRHNGQGFPCWGGRPENVAFQLAKRKVVKTFGDR